MVKSKGFKIVVTMSIIAVLLTLTGCKCKNKKANLNNSETIEEMIAIEGLDAPMEYISRDLRTSEQVTLKRHDDGTLWSCFVTTETCHMVKE